MSTSDTEILWKALRISGAVVLAVIFAVAGLAALFYKWEKDAELYASDPEFVLQSETPSPDGHHVILTYAVDIGGLGYTRTRTAVVPAEHARLDLRDFESERPYHFVRWLDTGELVVEEFEPHPDPENGIVLASGDSLFGHRVHMVSSLPSSQSTVW